MNHTVKVGTSVPRTDGEAKVTGRAIYVDDLCPDGLLYGATVRSPVAHGRLKGIRYDPAFDWTDFTRVDHTDLDPACNVVTLIEDDQPYLAADVVRHCDEPVVLLACADKRRLLEAVSHVQLDIEPLAAALDLEAALEGSVSVGGDAENVVHRIDLERGNLDAAFAEAAHVVEGEYRVGHQEQMYIEPQGMIATPLPDGVMRIEGSLQCPYYVVKALTRLLGVGEEGLQVCQAVTGGGFGGKEEYPSMIAGHAALLARKAGAPVKLVYDRQEDIRATTKRHPAIVRHRTAVAADGSLLGADITLDLDAGAYITLTPVVQSRALIHAVGPYACGAVRIRSRAVATHTPPNGAFRGFGAPQVCFASERQMDRVARTVGCTPLEIRRRNMLGRGGRTATNQVLDVSVGATEVLERTLASSGFEALYNECLAQDPAARVRRGVGLSFFFHGAGFTGNGESWLQGKADVSTRADGGLTVHSGSTDIGQGTRTIFSQLAAQTAGIPVVSVDVPAPDTSNVPDSGPTVASRTSMVVGKIVVEATKLVIADLTAYLEETHGAGVGFEDGTFRGPSNDIGTFEEVARRHHAECGEIRRRWQYEPPQGTVWDPDSYQGDAYPCYGWAALVCEVEVDLDTAETRITRVHTAQDVGKALHPVMVIGQIVGGTLQGLAYAGLEEVKMKDGAVWNDRMTNCIIPTALDAPEILVDLVEVPFPYGPHGAKGIGELPMDGPAPAVAQAVEMATGVAVDAAPFSAEMLARRLVEDRS